MRSFLERAGQVLLLGALLVVPLTFTEAMPPQNAAAVLQGLQLTFYRNFVSRTWSFDGFLACNAGGYNPFLQGACAANGQGLQHIPDLSLGTCLLYTTESWGQMIGLLIRNAGPPYGPAQTEGGCTDQSGNPPEGTQGSNCTGLVGNNGFAVKNVNPLLVRSASASIPSTACYACAQGPDWLPCQAGVIGCANPPYPGSCAPQGFFGL